MTHSIHDAERVHVKLFAEGDTPDAAALIPVFHRWIREAVIDDELIIDVADYSHVHEGPGVVLIGHASDYYFDLHEGRPGLLYSRKRDLEGDLRARLTDAFARAERAAALLEAEPGIALKFSRAEVLVRIPDRLNAPNEDDAFNAFSPLLEEVASAALGKKATVARKDAGSLEALSATVTV